MAGDHCLSNHIVEFKRWADGYPDKGSAGEWECIYPGWQALEAAFVAQLASCAPEAADAGIYADILYVIGLDSEAETFAEMLSAHPAWFASLIPTMLQAESTEVKWLFATQLGTGALDFHCAEAALLCLIENRDEYVRRMALKSLGRIGSSHAEALCERAWATGQTYQRIMALWVLKEIGSPRLAKYLSYAHNDGNVHVVSSADKIAGLRA